MNIKLSREAIFFGVFIITAVLLLSYYFFLRLPYPYDLEWLEGLHLQHSIRILYGKPLYIKPSLEFIPLLYTPLYYYVSAISLKLFGISYFSARLVSIVSSLGTALIIFLFSNRIQQHNGERNDGYLMPIVLAVLFLTFSFQTQFWFDLIKVDMLMVFLLSISIYILYFYSSKKEFILSFFFFVLAFYTKQTVLTFLPFIYLQS